MQLWSVHDDPTHCCYEEERDWALIWADTEAEALAIARETYRGDGSSDEVQFEATGHPDIDATPPDTAGRTHDPHLMRLAGWCEDGEHFCDSCGLAPMGLDGIAVCPDCNQCTECGCDCDNEKP